MCQYAGRICMLCLSFRGDVVWINSFPDYTWTQETSHLMESFEKKMPPPKKKHPKLHTIFATAEKSAGITAFSCISL